MTLGSGDEALRVLRDGELTLVLLDAAAADATGTARRLSALACVAGIIAFAMTDDVEARLTLAECGVRGYVSRDGSVSELLAAARGALRGELDCGPEFAGALARRLARVAASPGADRVDRLSFRERDIVRLVDDGMSNKEIARRLHIEVATVKNHMHHILHKLGVQRRGEAAAALRRWRASLDRSIASA